MVANPQITNANPRITNGNKPNRLQMIASPQILPKTKKTKKQTNKQTNQNPIYASDSSSKAKIEIRNLT